MKITTPTTIYKITSPCPTKMHTNTYYTEPKQFSFASSLLVSEFMTCAAVQVQVYDKE